jgi:hypothetical protein
MPFSLPMWDAAKVCRPPPSVCLATTSQGDSEQAVKDWTCRGKSVRHA